MTVSKDIKVEVTFLPTEHGGKTLSVKSGYRPQFYYDNHDWVVHFTFIDVELVNPGDKVQAYLTFLSPAEHWGKIKENDHFIIREGQMIFGYGHVIEIIDLEKSAERQKNV